MATTSSRHRVYRERRTRGARIVQIEVRGEHIAALISRGYLDAANGTKRGAIGRAVEALLSDGLGIPRACEAHGAYTVPQASAVEPQSLPIRALSATAAPSSQPQASAVTEPAQAAPPTLQPRTVPTKYGPVIVPAGLDPNEDVFRLLDAMDREVPNSQRVLIWNIAQSPTHPQHAEAVDFVRPIAAALGLSWRPPALAAPLPHHPAPPARVEAARVGDGAAKPRAVPEAPRPRAAPYETNGLFDEPPAAPSYWPSDAAIATAYPLAAPYVRALRDRQRDRC